MANSIYKSMFALGLGLTGGSLLFGQVSYAQLQDDNATFQDYSSPVTPNAEGFQRNERSSSGGEILGNGFDPINLIHNANLRRSRGGGEFAEDTHNNLSKAAAEFKRQQQLQLQQTQANPATPAVTQP